MHRKIAYEDILMEFSAEEVLLHGSVGGVQNQRRHLFRGWLWLNHLLVTSRGLITKQHVIKSNYQTLRYFTLHRHQCKKVKLSLFIP